jgi:hypothetical protein
MHNGESVRPHDSPSKQTTGHVRFRAFTGARSMMMMMMIFRDLVPCRTVGKRLCFVATYWWLIQCFPKPVVSADESTRRQISEVKNKATEEKQSWQMSANYRVSISGHVENPDLKSWKSKNSYKIDLNNALKTYYYLCLCLSVLQPWNWTTRLWFGCGRQCQLTNLEAWRGPRATAWLQIAVLSLVGKERKPCDRSNDSQTYKRVLSTAKQTFEPPPYPAVCMSAEDLLRAHKHNIRPCWDNKLQWLKNILLSSSIHNISLQSILFKHYVVIQNTDFPSENSEGAETSNFPPWPSPTLTSKFYH